MTGMSLIKVAADYTQRLANMEARRGETAASWLAGMFGDDAVYGVLDPREHSSLMNEADAIKAAHARMKKHASEISDYESPEGDARGKVVGGIAGGLLGGSAGYVLGHDKGVDKHNEIVLQNGKRRRALNFGREHLSNAEAQEIEQLMKHDAERLPNIRRNYKVGGSLLGAALGAGLGIGLGHLGDRENVRTLSLPPIPD
jgi:uncharacterized protein YcfJ